MLGDYRAVEESLALCAPAEDGEFGPRLQAEALLARAEITEDVEAARSAYQIATAAPMALHAAQAQLLRGQLGDNPEETLTDAWRRFRNLQADVWRRRTAAALRSRRLPVPRAQRQRPDELSEVERQMIELVREGLSNQEIANRLSYSKHTVTAYLTRIYMKTGCSRLDLVRQH
jgi:DNA-binding CsgD family transcriptional regulator